MENKNNNKKLRTLLPYSSNEEFGKFYPLLTGNPDTAAKTVTFVVTEDCTLRCSYCYECHKNNKHRMSLDTAKKFIDLLFEEDKKNTDIVGQYSATALILDFIGGEPLLEIELIDQIVDYFIKKAVELNHRWQTEYMISMISNGTEYFKPEVQNFINKYQGRLSLSITIDGNKNLHDACRKFPDGRPSFDIAEKAYKDCLKRGLTTSTKMTIAPANLKYLSEALKNLCSYEGVKHVPANPVFEEEWTIEQAKEYYRQLIDFAQWLIDTEKYTEISTTLFESENLGFYDYTHNGNWCGGTGKMLACSTEGDIYPCMRYLPFALRNKDKREKMIIGNVDEGIVVSPEEQKRFNCLECISLRSQSQERCINCPISAGCAWCSAWNYDYYGTPNRRFTGICNMHKARVLANVWYWNTLYRKLEMSERFPMNVPKDWALEIISEEEYNNLVELAKEN